MNLVSFPLPRGSRGFQLVAGPATGGPAYDLEQKGEDGYVLTLAVPGFA